MTRPDRAAGVDTLVDRDPPHTVQLESILRARGHICAFFHGADEEYRVLLPLLKHGFECGDRNVHLVDRREHSNHVCRLTSAGIDVSNAEQRGQFAMLSTDDVYSPDGVFDTPRMIDFVQQTLEDGKRRGYPLTRIVGHVKTDTRPDDDAWLEYEARLSKVLQRYEDPVVCIYDLSAISGAFVVDVMRTHPLIIIGETLCENPFYTPPDEFLRQRRERIARNRGRRESPDT
jgi:MEDS: MEthanogen/methylotroph, DcmR Sensory domain